METFIVKAQMAAAEADTAMQHGNFKLVYEKYEEAASLYGAAMRRATDPNTKESLRLFQNMYAEKARHMCDYLESEKSFTESGLHSDEHDPTNESSIYDSSALLSVLDGTPCNYDYYYNHPVRSNSFTSDTCSTTSTPHASPPRQSPPDKPDFEKTAGTSPLELLVLPFARGFRTVKNFVYNTTHPKADISPPSSAASNSLDESFYFVPDDLPTPGTSPTNAEAHNLRTPQRQRSSSDLLVQTHNAFSQTRAGGSEGYALRPDEIVVNRQEYENMKAELQRLRAAVAKLREQNAKLLQLNNTSGMHSLVRENTQLKRSLMNLRKV